MLVQTGIMDLAKAERVGKACIEKYRDVAAANGQFYEEQVLLNRMRFAEVLLTVLFFKEQDSGAPSSSMEVIPEEEELGDSATKNSPKKEF